MNKYIIDPNLGSYSKFNNIIKFIDYTRKRPATFKLIFGGTKYITELNRVETLKKYIFELRKNELADKYCNEEIDREQQKFDVFVTNIFDDPHIYALVNKAECNIIATQDKGIPRFFKTYKSQVTYTPDFYYKNDFDHYEPFIKKYK